MAHIAIIGAGNIGGTLARKWKAAGHRITVGSRDTSDAETRAEADSNGYDLMDTVAAMQQNEISLVAIPGKAVEALATAAGTLSGKLIIDATNMGGAAGFAALRSTGADVVKAFNCTGWENLADPQYPDGVADMFMAGGSEAGRARVRALARDVGFPQCHDLGGDDKVPILENFALLWIDLAIMQRMGRGIAFRLMTR